MKTTTACKGARLTRSEDDDVLGYAGVEDVHGTHSAAGIIEHPLFLVGVDVLCTVLGHEVRHNVVDNLCSRIGLAAVE